MIILETITALSVSFAALYGVSEWRREFVGKRRIELAEAVLAIAYEIEDTIRSIRSPFIHVAQPGKNSEETHARNLVDVINEKILSKQELFAKYHSYKYRFKATFGDDTDQSFSEIKDVMDEINTSAEMLGKHYCIEDSEKGMDTDELSRYREEKRRHESIIWDMGNKRDEIGPRVKEAVRRIEDIVRKENIKQKSLLERLFGSCKM